MSGFRPATEIWKHIRQVDWRDPAFDPRKAYVCALFANLAYRRIADFERADAPRANIIPCFAFQEAIRDGRTIDFDEELRAGDFGEVFAIVRRYAIVVGVRTPDVIFVSFRGTTYLYDWLTNLRATRFPRETLLGTRAHFHRGFLRGYFCCHRALMAELHAMLSRSPGAPLYICGHSLGGAVGALMNAAVDWRAIRVRPPKAVATYVFGMPRYGDRVAVNDCQAPLHLYHELDIVPTVPSTLLGYANSPNEFLLEPGSITYVPRRARVPIQTWLGRVTRRTGIEAHAIELYVETLRGVI